MAAMALSMAGVTDRHDLWCSCRGSCLGVDCFNWTGLVWTLADGTMLCAPAGVG
jgi:hypothetical protein